MTMGVIPRLADILIRGVMTQSVVPWLLCASRPPGRCRLPRLMMKGTTASHDDIFDSEWWNRRGEALLGYR